MLHLYPDGRDLSVICLLFIGKDATLRLFKRHDGVVPGSVSDISGILMHRPLLRKAVLNAGDPLVMDVSRYGRADKKNTYRDGGDYRVLDGMPLLLAAVLILLLFTVHRTRNLPLRAVMKQVGRQTVGLHALKYALESLVGGSELLRCIVCGRMPERFLPSTVCQRKYSSWVSAKYGRNESNISTVIPVRARNLAAFALAVT